MRRSSASSRTLLTRDAHGANFLFKAHELELENKQQLMRHFEVCPQAWRSSANICGIVLFAALCVQPTARSPPFAKAQIEERDERLKVMQSKVDALSLAADDSSQPKVRVSLGCIRCGSL